MLYWLLCGLSFAEEGVKFTPHGEIRPRLETHSGKDGMEEGIYLAISQRSRLGGTFSQDKFSLKMMLQDVRIWGEEFSTFHDYNADNFDMHEAYIQWKPKKKMMVRVGRQEIVMHEQRLVGNDNWFQQGRAFNGGRFSFKDKNFSMDMIGAMLGEGDTTYWEKNATLAILRAGFTDKAKDPKMQADVLLIRDADVNTELERYTLGSYLRTQRSGFHARLEGYYQTGSFQGVPIQSYMFGLQGTFIMKAPGKPEITLWYDQLSGDDTTSIYGGTEEENTINTFQPLFGNNHRFYGLIDIVGFEEGAFVDGQGLQDVALKFAVGPGKKLKTKIGFHFFMVPNPIPDFLGNELDLTMAYTINKGLKLQGGVSYFMWESRDANDSWGWLQLAGKL